MVKVRPPALIALDPDEYSAQHVGHTAEGLQFFLSTPFVAAVRSDPGREFVALYLFRNDGSLAKARIDDVSLPTTPEAAGRLIAQHLASLGQYPHRRIQMQPFEILRFGTAFRLILRPPEEDDRSWWAEFQPGNYMAFHEP